MAHTNDIESVWAVLKRGCDGTDRNFSRKHLHRYVDELSFRLNDGSMKRHSLKRTDVLCAGAAGKRITYKKLIS